MYIDSTSTNPSGSRSLPIDCVNAVTRIVGRGCQTWGHKSNVDWPIQLFKIVEDLVFVVVSVTVKLGRHRGLKSVNNFGKFPAKDCPAIKISWRNVAEDMYLIKRHFKKKTFRFCALECAMYFTFSPANSASSRT